MTRQWSPIQLGRGVATCTVAVALTVTLALAAPEVSGERLRVPTTAELVDQLQHREDPRARRLAAWWLGEHEDVCAVDALITTLLEDPSPIVSAMMAF